MIRIYLEESQNHEYFDNIKRASNLSNVELAQILKVNLRTVVDWQKGKHTFPKSISDLVFSIFQIQLPQGAKEIEESERRLLAARKGGLTSYSRYGSPGTPEGRRKGGIASLATHHKRNTGFKLKKEIPFSLEYSENLAELFGAIIGDGGLTKYQTRISLSLKEDFEYANYISRLATELFLLSPSRHHHPKRGVVEVCVSSKSLVEYLNNNGLPIGNKVSQMHNIPDWIKSDERYLKSCLRGIFDTDGSVYLDSHITNEVLYQSINIAFTSYSVNLFNDIYYSLKKLGLHPTSSSPHNILLRRAADINPFFVMIGSSNPKHINRFKRFKEECREW